MIVVAAMNTGRALLKPLCRSAVSTPKNESSQLQLMSLVGLQVGSRRNFSSQKDGEASSGGSHSNPSSAKEGWLKKLFQFDNTTASHSTVVGSPTVYRLVFVRTKPQHMNEFVKLGNKMLPEFAEPRDDCRLVGAWQTVVGRTDEIVHLWQYKDGYKTLDEFGADVFPREQLFKEYRHKCAPLIKDSYSQILMQFGYFDEPQERNDKHIYELRSYKLKPGSMIEWANHWSKGIDYRKSDNQNVAGMFTHIGDLNMVHHIWAYKNFQDRNRIRHKSWANSGWSQTVTNTVPLIKSIRSRIMVAMPYSWLK